MRKLFFAFVLSLGMTSVSFATETVTKTTEITPAETETVKKTKKAKGGCIGYMTSCTEGTHLACANTPDEALEEIYAAEAKCG